MQETVKNARHGLYDERKTAATPKYGLADWTEIEQEVSQVCIMSLRLLNICSEAIMREALFEFKGSITINGR